MHEYVPYYKKLGDFEHMMNLHKEYPEQAPDPHEYIERNMLRYAYTFQWIEPYLDMEIRALDLGQHHSFFSRFLTYMRPSVIVELAQCDFRHVLSTPNVWFSVILNMDVLEFIKDQQSTPPKHWVNYTGVDKFLWECHRTARQRGYMILTTPNACSLRNVQRILQGEAPLHSRTHAREYTVEEIRSLLEAHEFEVIRLETLDIYEGDKMGTLRDGMKSGGYSLDNRGDEIFALAKRPI